MTDKKSSGLHWFSPTFVRPGLALAAVGIFSLGALQWSVHAQAPAAKDINPPVDNCNKVVEDTIPDPADPKKRIARKIVPELLTSGLPCAQIASGLGLLIDNPLGNRQRSFDFYSWLTFIALNSPADGKTIGQGPRPGGDAATKWESVSNYRQLADVMLEKGVRPTWGTRIVPDACKALDAPNKMIVTLGEAAWNQPFKTGPLIDQNGNYAVFDILMNEVMFDFIDQNGLYSKQGQERFDGDVVFPLGVNPVINTADPSKNAPGRMGAIMIKVSWRVLDPEKDKALMAKFHTVDALVYFPGPPATKTGPTCVARTLGLIGFHVGHKTAF